MALKISSMLCCIALFSYIDAAAPSLSKNHSRVASWPEIVYDPRVNHQEYQDERLSIHNTTNAKKHKGQSRMKKVTRWLVIRALVIATVIGVASLIWKIRAEKEPEDKPKFKPVLTQEELRAFSDTRMSLAMSVIEMNKLFGSKQHSPGLIFSNIKTKVQNWNADNMKKAEDAIARLEADPTLTPEEKNQIETIKAIYKTKVIPSINYAAPMLIDYVKESLYLAMGEAEAKQGFDPKPLRDLLDTVNGKAVIPVNKIKFTEKFLEDLRKNKDNIPDADFPKLERFADDCYYILEPMIEFNNFIAPIRNRVEKFLDKISDRNEAFRYAANIAADDA